MRESSSLYCSEPFVEICCTPGRCADSLSRKILRLIDALLPDISLPDDADSDTVEVLLELVMAENHCVSSFVHPHSLNGNCGELESVPSSELLSSVPGACLLFGTASLSDIPVHCSDKKLSVSYNPLLSSHAFGYMPPTPSSLLDKKSIKRQVKDCLMFLDKDLT